MLGFHRRYKGINRWVIVAGNKISVRKSIANSKENVISKRSYTQEHQKMEGVLKCVVPLEDVLKLLKCLKRRQTGMPCFLDTSKCKDISPPQVDVLQIKKFPEVFWGQLDKLIVKMYSWAKVWDQAVCSWRGRVRWGLALPVGKTGFCFLFLFFK